MVYERELKLEKEFLKKHFEKMGARVKFRALLRDRRRRDSRTTPFIIDIDNDKKSSFFDIEGLNFNIWIISGKLAKL
jgi:hypothetical protein